MAEDTGPEVKLNGASSAPSVAGAEPRKRGRPPGSGNKSKLGETPVAGDAPRASKKKPQVEYDREAVAKQLKGTHYLIAMAFSMPELILSDEQSLELAEVMIGFAREYDFEPDSKIMAALNLLAVAGFIYGPKVVAIAVRLKKQKAGKGQTIDGVATPVEPSKDGTTAH